MIAALLLSLAGDAKVSFEAPSYFVAGQPFKVRLALEGAPEGSKLEGWQATAAGFTVDGQPLGAQGNQSALELKAGEKKLLEVDLAASLKATADFQLGWGALPAQRVRVLEAAPKDVKFLDEAALPASELTKYWVLLSTNRGDILAEFWPDVAPGHVRNFLDLSATGFYNGTTFHRVIPGFMIQGGDPDGDGTGNGPRTLKAEFNAKKHVRGVLSAARQGTGAPGPQDPLKDTASCQFFIMHQASTHLDGSYSGFGQVVTGLEVVDKIVNTPRGQQDRPREPQVIQRAVVIRAPADPAAWKAQK